MRIEPDPHALPTRQELASRLDDPALTILDVRREEEYTGKRGSACDPRQGHIPGAIHIELDELLAAEPAALRGLLESKGVQPGRPTPAVS